jgi:endoglucanase
MTDGAPDYTLDPLFLGFLDQVVDWAEELEIYLILDSHTFSPSENTDPNVGTILAKVWSQMATRYRECSEYLCYEVLNEPHGISDQLWNNIQLMVVDEIRKIDTTHYIIIGPASWNSYNNLDEMPVYPGGKLIYTFHFYDPFLFTHQGASWTSPSMEPVMDIPFPADSGEIPPVPPSLVGTWIGNSYNNYPIEGTGNAKFTRLPNFREQRGTSAWRIQSINNSGGLQGIGMVSSGTCSIDGYRMDHLDYHGDWTVRSSTMVCLSTT